MKKFLIMILICCVHSGFAQTKDSKTDNGDNENVIYNTAGVEIQPEFPGGIQEFYKFLNTNFIPPQEKPKLKGKIYATFVIEKDGSLSDIKIIRDLGFGTKEEAIRVLKLSPKWTPARHHNKDARTLSSTAINVRQ